MGKSAFSGFAASSPGCCGCFGWASEIFRAPSPVKSRF
jgi:hypothetical protein